MERKNTKGNVASTVYMYMYACTICTCTVRLHLHECTYVCTCMNNHVHSAPQLERKKEKNREERKKNYTL